MASRSDPEPSALRHADVHRQLSALAERGIPGWQTQVLGRSVEGRDLTMVTVGQGTIPVLLWSQMHGDEPTHTAVLLMLLAELAGVPPTDAARCILQHCALHLIPMLNPDGAEHWTRRNAQDIDVNRDALHRQTPEARALWKAVEQVRPAFGFNLHNQQRRTAVSGTQLPAAVSLLVPPVDVEETETSGTLLARHVASVFCRTVQDRCPGMVSRYPAEFMARAFGDSIQQTGCSTVLVEAGDWLGHSPRELAELHLMGLRAALMSIATSTYRDVPVTVYNGLPRNSEHPLFDRKVRDMWLFSGSRIAPLRGDLGVQIQSTRDEKYPAGRGTIDDLGDLRVSRGAVEWSLPGGYCTPGFVTLDPRISPVHLPDLAAYERLAAHGITLLIGMIDLADPKHLAALPALRDARFPLHLGFVTGPPDWQRLPMNRFLPLALETVLAVVAEGGGRPEPDRCPAWDVPWLSPSSLPTRLPPQVLPWGELPHWTAEATSRLEIGRHGVLRRGASADLLLFSGGSYPEADALRWDQLERVVVGGTEVWTPGGLLADRPGRLVSRQA